MTADTSAKRPPPDPLLVQIADYVSDARPPSAEAFDKARLCLMDSLGCMMLALNFPECVNMLGPVVPGAELPGGARVPGTRFELDPVQAAFNIGCLVRWLDYNDTWLAAEWGHPSDNLGGILAVADYLSRGRGGLRIDFGEVSSSLSLPSGLSLRVEDRAEVNRQSSLLIHDVLSAMTQAHEVQGVLALENAFNRVGLDHVILVRVASTAVCTRMLGGTREQIVNALSNAWIDGGALRTYRHAPNAGPRKSWAAGDATSRAVRLALMAVKGMTGYPSALTAKTWGFYDVLFRGQRFAVSRPFGSYVMENVLFKVSYPAEFHAQTAVEAAIRLHPQLKERLDQVERVVIETQESGCRIIDKTGPLSNYADRDHCLQYMVAMGLIHGNLTAEMYGDDFARDPRIDELRRKMRVVENPKYSRDYLDPEKRSIANAVQICFADGTSTERVEVEYPVGHRRRRREAVPLLREKLRAALATRMGHERSEPLLRLFDDPTRLDGMPVEQFMAMLVG